MMYSATTEFYDSKKMFASLDRLSESGCRWRCSELVWIDIATMS